MDDRNYDSRYQTAYPGYDSNTPDYYGRYAGQQTTQDYWAARYPTTTPSSEDPYGQTGLIGTVTASPQTTDIYWSPYWGAATEPQRAVTNSPSGSGSAGGRHSATRKRCEPRIELLRFTFVAFLLQLAVPNHQVMFESILWKIQQKLL